MMKFSKHADRIVKAAVEDIFSRDLYRTPEKTIEDTLAAYASALRAIGAEI